MDNIFHAKCGVMHASVRKTMSISKSNAEVGGRIQTKFVKLALTSTIKELGAIQLGHTTGSKPLLLHVRII